MIILTTQAPISSELGACVPHDAHELGSTSPFVVVTSFIDFTGHRLQ